MPSLSDYPGALDTTNLNFREIIDFDQRVEGSTVDEYVVKAADILVLQDAIFAIETALGVDPQGSSQTVAERIAASEALGATTDAYDVRWGGKPFTDNGASDDSWTEVYNLGNPTQKQLITILGHRHNGVYNDKVELTTDVKGLLPKTNLDLTVTGLTAADMRTSVGIAETVATALADCLRKSAVTSQTISAPIIHTGALLSNLFKEWDCKDGAVGSSVSNTKAWSGSSVQFLTATPTSTYSIKHTGTLRYGAYSLALRAKVSANTSTSTIATVIVCSGTQTDPTVGVLATLAVKPSLFSGTSDFCMLHLPFEFNGTRPTTTITVFVKWLGTAIANFTFDVDAIVVSPTHLSVYDI